MNKITKFMFSMFSALALFVIVSNIELAEASTFKINDMESLKAEIVELNQIPNNEDGTERQEKIDFRAEIIKNTNPQVLEEYHIILAEDIKNTDINVTGTDTVNILGNDNVSSEEITLPNSNAKIEIITETKNDKSILPRLAVNHGTTDYLITHVISATLYPDSKAVLTTTYNVTSKGLKAENCTKAGTTGFFPTTIVSSCSITDDKATAYGHDINALGEYNVTIAGYNGIGIITYELAIRSSIKWTGTLSSKQQIVERTHTVQKY